MTDDRLHAVLIEPQLARFRARFDLADVPLTADFSGFHRHVIASPDRVYLFPRHREHVRLLVAEHTILQALDGFDVPAPRVVGLWRDADISPYPFLGLSRLPGIPWSRLENDASFDDVESMLRSLGGAIARWHGIEPPISLRRRRSSPATALAVRLRIDALRDTARTVADALDRPRTDAERWCRTLEPLTTLDRVFVHGDVHESQLMIDSGSVTGVLDWEWAGMGHPLQDFDFGEWGAGIFRWEDDFAALRRTLWESYAAARGVPLPPWYAVHLFFCLREAAYFSQQGTGSDWDQQRLACNRRLFDELDPMVG